MQTGLMWFVFCVEWAFWFYNNGGGGDCLTSWTTISFSMALFHTVNSAVRQQAGTQSQIFPTEKEQESQSAAHTYWWNTFRHLYRQIGLYQGHPGALNALRFMATKKGYLFGSLVQSERSIDSSVSSKRTCTHCYHLPYKVLAVIQNKYVYIYIYIILYTHILALYTHRYVIYV